MLSNDFIRETWEIETGVSEQGVEWDVIGFARAIEQAAGRGALKLALSEIACATSRSEAYKAIYALIEHETK